MLSRKKSQQHTSNIFLGSVTSVPEGLGRIRCRHVEIFVQKQPLSSAPISLAGHAVAAARRQIVFATGYFVLFGLLKSISRRKVSHLVM